MVALASVGASYLHSAPVHPQLRGVAARRTSACMVPKHAAMKSQKNNNAHANAKAVTSELDIDLIERVHILYHLHECRSFAPSF